MTIGAFYGHFESKRTVLFTVVRAIGSNMVSRRFASAPALSLLLTVASFAHTDEEAAAVLGEVLRGAVDGHPDEDALDAVDVGELIVALSK